MNERRSELVERIHGEILSVYTDGYDHEVSDIVEHARRVITLVTKHRDAEIREALEAEYERVKEENTGLMGDYDLETAGTLSGLSFAIGLGDGTGGQG